MITMKERTSTNGVTKTTEALELHSSFEAAGLYAHGVRPDGVRREPDGHCTFLFSHVPTDLVHAILHRRPQPLTEPRPLGSGQPTSASVVIPNWNGKDLLEKYLPSVIEAMGGHLHRSCYSELATSVHSPSLPHL